MQSAEELRAAESQKESAGECWLIAVVRDERARSGVLRPRPKWEVGSANGREPKRNGSLVPASERFGTEYGGTQTE